MSDDWDMMKGNLNMNNDNIINIGFPVNGEDAVNLEAVSLKVLDLELKFKEIISIVECSKYWIIKYIKN